MKFLKFLLYGAGGFALLVILLGVLAKKNYVIERSIEINAPRDTVYNQVRFFKNHPSWSPWSALDDQEKTAVTGTDGAVGATYSWDGNKEVGKGSQVVTFLSPDSMVLEVRNLKPWEKITHAVIKMEDRGGQTTKVTYTFDRYIGFPWNAMAMLTDVDKAVGKDCERGLGNLKKICEQLAHPHYSGYVVAVADIPVKYYVGIRSLIDTLPDSIQVFYLKTLPLAYAAIETAKATVAGSPTGLFWTWGPDSTDMAVAVPMAEQKKLGSGVGVFTIGGGKALMIDYYGPHDSTYIAHGALEKYMQEKKLRSIPPIIEEYVTDPAMEPDTLKWLTKVIYFVAPKVDSVIVK